MITIGIVIAALCNAALILSLQVHFYNAASLLIFLRHSALFRTSLLLVFIIFQEADFRQSITWRLAIGLQALYCFFILYQPIHFCIYIYLSIVCMSNVIYLPSICSTSLSLLAPSLASYIFLFFIILKFY